MGAPFVEVRVEEHVAIVQLSRPRTRNAFSKPEDCAEMQRALRTIDADENVRALIITGGPVAFSSGGDLTGLRDRNGIGPRETPEATRQNVLGGLGAMIHAARSIDTPSIAAINGAAYGLGLSLALACDLRVCGQSAKFATPYHALGIGPADGAAWALPRAIGSQRAREMMLTCEPIDAEQALAYGLVARVTPDDQVLDAAITLAKRIAANPRDATRMSKRLLREAQHQRLGDALELAAAFQAIAHESEEHKQALQAALRRLSDKQAKS